jgi:hypothetical protein
MEKLIRTDKGSWNDVVDPREAIEAWEAKENRRLPDDYRSFVIAYNGGRVFPLMFRY